MIYPKTFLIVVLLTIFGIISFPIPASGQERPVNSPADKYLAEAKTPSDSIRALLRAYTEGDKFTRTKMKNQIVTLVSNSTNQELINDVVKELVRTTDDANQLTRLIEITNHLPGENSETMKTLMVMEDARAEAANVQDSDVKNEIIEFTRNSFNLYGDPYKEIQNIFRVMVYLGTSSQGPMYLEYLRRLEDLIDALPKEDHGIKILYYTNGALFYTRQRDYKKAIELDRNLIHELDAIKAHYDKTGQTNKDLDYFYYISYRRLLRNFRGLTPQEIEEAFQKCVEFAEKNEEAAEAFGNGGLAKSYYYFATGKYAEAVPELRKALKAEDISDFRRQELLGLLAYSLRKTGDTKGELDALRDYTMMQIADRDQRRQDTYREIELRNSVNQLLAEEYQDQEQQRQQNRVMRKTALTLVYVLAVVLIFITGAYFRLRNRVKDLEMKNSKLRKNIEYIFDDGVPKGTKDLRHQKNRLKG